MKTIHKQTNEKIKVQCERLSQANRRRFLVGLLVLYCLCAVWMIAQFFLPKETNLELRQVKTIRKHSIQTDSLLMQTHKPVQANNKQQTLLKQYENE